MKAEERVINGTSVNELSDSCFAWISDSWKAMSEEAKRSHFENNSSSWHRKLPYRDAAGGVDRAAWKIAWRQVAWSTFSAHTFEGGSSGPDVVEVLKANVPVGITLHKDNTFRDSNPILESDEGDRYGREVCLEMKPTLVESITPGDNNALLQISEVASDSMFVEGVALFDGQVSSAGRLYTREFNDKAMEATLDWMADGHTVTVYSRHGRAIPPRGQQFSRDIPIGRIVTLFRKDNAISYQGFIAPTAEGRDVQTLVKTGCLFASSIRTAIWTSQPATLNGQEVEEMLSATIQGIDFADEPGIEGAGVYKILEGDIEVQPMPVIMESNEQIMEDNNVDELKDVTLEQFKEARSDLVDAIKGEVMEAVNETKDTELKGLTREVLDAKCPALVEAIKTETLDATTEETDKLRFEITILEASQLGLSKKLADKVRAAAKTPEEVAEAVVELRKAVVDEALNTNHPKEPTSAAGKQTLATEEKTKQVNKGRVTEMDEMVNLSIGEG